VPRTAGLRLIDSYSKAYKSKRMKRSSWHTGDHGINVQDFAISRRAMPVDGEPTDPPPGQPG
jgi:hypothetical protein